MAWFNTKKVKKCICGKEPKATIVYDDKMQARRWLLILGDSLLLASFILIFVGGYDAEAMRESWWIFLLAAVFWLFFTYFTFKYKNEGHSWKCSMRQAFLKVV